MACFFSPIILSGRRRWRFYICNEINDPYSENMTACTNSTKSWCSVLQQKKKKKMNEWNFPNRSKSARNRINWRHLETRFPHPFDSARNSFLLKMVRSRYKNSRRWYFHGVFRNSRFNFFPLKKRRRQVDIVRNETFGQKCSVR